MLLATVQFPPATVERLWAREVAEGEAMEMPAGEHGVGLAREAAVVWAMLVTLADWFPEEAML